MKSINGKLIYSDTSKKNQTMYVSVSAFQSADPFVQMFGFSAHIGVWKLQ